MLNFELTVQAEQLFFYYLTPTKVPLFSGLPFLKQVKYEKHVVLQSVNFQMRSKRITALLGRNGSGKTTLIKLISGIRSPHQGQISVFGLSPKKASPRIGLCAGPAYIYHRLTARENLEYYGRLYQVHGLSKRIADLAGMLGLDSHLDEMVETFSFGMKAKLGLARAIIHSPDLLILDEPTLGIDLELALQIRDFVRSLKCTVLLTTHYMEEAQQLADDVCFIEQGKILGFGSQEEVLRKMGVTSVAEAYTRALGTPSSLKVAS